MDTKFLYLTTTGRLTGTPREIEIWFVEAGGKYYVLSYLLDRAQWVKNIQKNPRVRVRVREQQFNAIARVLDQRGDVDAWNLARHLSQEKYGWSEGLPIEIAPLAEGQGT